MNSRGFKGSKNMTAQLRKEKHQVGKDFMKNEDFYDAMNIFLEALKAYGPHVGLISDLIACFYMLGRFEDCMATAKRLELELSQALPLLQKKNAARTYLFLGKIYEETAQVAKAMSFYRQAIDICDADAAEIKIQAQAQLLRLQSFLGIKTGLAHLYRICLKLKTQSLYLQTELTHALVLAELVLFGAQTATARALQFLKNNSVLNHDARLILVDLLEECIREHLKCPELTESLKLNPLKNLDPFEETVFNFFQFPNQSLSAAELTNLEKNISIMGMLRLFVINLKRTKDRELNLELQRKVFFILDALDTDSKNMLLKKCDLNFYQQAKEIVFNPEEGTVTVQGKNLNLRKDSFALLCFEAFSANRTIAIEQINTHIFGFSANSNLYDRIRIAFWRLNKELRMITGLEKVFIFSKNGVQLNKTFTITKKFKS